MNFSPIIERVRGALKVKGQFSIPYQKQESFLNSLTTPSCLIERSYRQYECFKFFVSWPTLFLLNVLGFILGNLFLLLCLFSFRPKRADKLDAIIDIHSDNDNIIPQSLKKEFPNMLDTEFDNKPYLSLTDFGYVCRIILKHPFECWFIFKVIFKISKYSAYIAKHSPRAFIVHNEYSFTSSVLTDYCNRNSIEHINFQHGERMWQLQCSFFTYDRCYVWDEYYINVMTELRAKARFIIEHPLTVKFDVAQLRKPESFYDLKYYLSIVDDEVMANIAQAMKRYGEKGFKWCVRLHPNYTDINIVSKYISEENIEPRNIGIEESLSNADNVCALYSTVLFQAYMNGINVVIDDISEQEKYDQLDSFKYIMMDKPHKTLSELTK